MSQATQNRDQALKVLLAAACLVVVIAGLKASGDVLLPILFSVFLSIVALPLVRALQRVGVPPLAGIPVVVVVAAAALVGVSSIFVGTASQFTADIEKYEQPFALLVQQAVGLAESLGFIGAQEAIKTGEVADFLTPGAIMGLVTQTINAVAGLFGRVVIVIVTMSFILFEASEIEQKVRMAFGTDASPAGPFTDAGEKVTRYLLIKTMISGVTGITAALLCRVLGLDFWVMWGLVAFLLNYIPSVGSILAAIPPVLLAVVQLGPGYALGIAFGYVGINILLGNILEPRLMGQSLGLSPLVVFLSLVFWGWVWGPVGMLLCVPMTVMAKLVLEGNEQTLWIAILLGNPRDVRRGLDSTGGPGPPRRASVAK